MNDQGNPIIRPLGSVDDVATLMKCSSKTVRRMVKEGKIPGVLRPNRLVRFNLELVSEWIKQGCPPLHRFDAKRS